MHWIPLTDEKQLDQIIATSFQTPIAIYKHSTRCSISLMVKRSLESDWKAPDEEIPAYYLDLLSFRSVSNKIAGIFGIRHESPQLILIKDGKAVYHASQSEIDYAEMSAKK